MPTRNILKDKLHTHPEIPSRFRIHQCIKLLLGWPTPRAFVYSLSPAKRASLWKYAEYCWLCANDNTGLRKVKRPRWFPKKYIYPQRPV